MADDPKVPFARSRDIIDAANLPFTPATLANWTGSADPGSTKAALDQLAARLVSGITTAPFQVPTVADAAALAALTASEGDIAWQADTNVLYVYTGAAWTSAVTAAALATAPFQVPTVADNAAKAALTASEGDLVWQADTDVLYVYTGVTWLAVLQSTDITALQTSRALQRIITVSVGAEAADDIPVTITVTDGAGAALSAPARLRLALYDDDVLDDIAVQAAFTITDGGDGSLSSSAAANSVYMWETGFTGIAVVNIHDVAGASGATKHLKIELIDISSPSDTYSTPIRLSVTFDGV